MDELDKKLFQLYNDINLSIKVPEKCENIIKEGLDNKKENKKIKYFSPVKIIAMTCASLIITIGIVYASVTISNKIWKKPERIVGFYSEEGKTTDIQDQKEDVMTKEEAEQRGKELLEKFGHREEKLKTIKLIDNPYSYEIEWHIETEKSIIDFNAKNGDSFSISFTDTLNADVRKYRSTAEEAEKTAREICKKYGYDLSAYSKVKVHSNVEKEKNSVFIPVEEESYIWYIDFYKEYDGIENPYESINIAFVPEINKIYYFNLNNLKYENNPIEITKEQAKQIITETEEQINNKYKIKNIDIALSIEKMNGDAYKRINEYEQYYKEGHTTNYPLENIVNYRTDNLVRKVWKVTIEYDVQKYKDDSNYNPLDKYYSYYIDVTTGEIIGGSQVD